MLSLECQDFVCLRSRLQLHVFTKHSLSGHQPSFVNSQNPISRLGAGAGSRYCDPICVFSGCSFISGPCLYVCVEQHGEEPPRLAFIVLLQRHCLECIVCQGSHYFARPAAVAEAHGRLQQLALQRTPNNTYQNSVFVTVTSLLIGLFGKVTDVWLCD